MTTNEAFQLMLKLLNEAPDLKSKISLDELTLQTEIRRDMGFDSLAFAAFFYELQDRFPELQEELAAKWITLGDCAVTLTKA
jgi:acyl carrier protein